MIDNPAIGGDVSLLEAGMAVAIFATGYVLHEALHVLPLKVWNCEYDLEVLPTPEGGSRLQALLFGGVVRIQFEELAWWRTAVVALAPLAMLPVPLAALVLMLQYPVVDMGTLLVVGAWFAVGLPSPPDWWTAFGGRHLIDASMEATHGQ